MYIAIHDPNSQTASNSLSNQKRREQIKYKYIAGTASYENNHYLIEKIEEWQNQLIADTLFNQGVDDIQSLLPSEKEFLYRDLEFDIMYLNSIETEMFLACYPNEPIQGSKPNADGQTSLF